MAGRSNNEGLEAALASIQPLRDLSKNWDVDIASCLQEYLHELVSNEDGMALSGQAGLIDDSIASSQSDLLPNFTQAAMLVHNSSHVYSRKVEYLYSLVYAALEEIAANHGNSAGKEKKRNRKTTNAAIEEFEAFDSHLNFLLLDDVLPVDETGTKINLTAAKRKRVSVDLDTTRTMLQHRLSAGERSRTRLSMGGLSMTKAHDSGMMPDAAFRKLASVMYNQGSEGCLRLLSQNSTIGKNGVLYMPGTCMGSKETQGGVASGDESEHQSFDPISNNNNDNGDGDGFLHDDGCDFSDGDARCTTNDQDNDMDKEGLGYQMADNEAANDDDRGTGQTVSVVTPEPVQEEPDPWEMLDAHDAGKRRGRALRVGKTYRLPEGVDEPPSECVTGSHTRRKPSVRAVQRRSVVKAVSIAATRFKTNMSNERKRLERLSLSMGGFLDGSDDDNGNGGGGGADNHKTTKDNNNENDDNGDSGDQHGVESGMSSVPMNRLAFGDEFAYIARAAAKRRAVLKREKRAKLAKNPSALPVREANALLGYDDRAAATTYDDDDNGGGFDGGFGNDCDGYEDDQETPNGDGNLYGNTSLSVASFDNGDPGLQEDNDDNSNPDATAFERLCRAHIRAFAKGAERYKAETKLTKRVGDWQGKLAPILEEEQQRPEFDINRYSEKVIDRMTVTLSDRKRKITPDPKKLVDFAEMSQNLPRYEVCRLFLASLSLSNSGNVQFVNTPSGRDAQTGTLFMRLLNTNIDRPTESFLAPSVQQT